MFTFRSGYLGIHLACSESFEARSSGGQTRLQLYTDVSSNQT